MNDKNLIIRSAVPFLLGVCLGASARAQGVIQPLEIRQDSTSYNLQSQRGVPLSETAGDPVGSDGRAPSQSQQIADGLTVNPPTLRQFQGFDPIGTVAAPRTPANLVSGRSLSANAGNIQLPRVPSVGQPAMILLNADVGAPYVSRQISFLFGSVIPAPETDESDTLLPEEVDPNEYWLAEPHTTDNHADTGYYWSPHANSVFAIQPGPIEVTWKKAVPLTAEPADFATNPNKYSHEGGNYFILYPVRYVVSGSAVKTPRKMFWTEGVYRNLGKPVAVPTARVGAVNFVYSKNFPNRVEKEFEALGQSHIVEDATQRLTETRTIWYDQVQGQILAFNQEGRIFMELLGDSSEDGRTRTHLGFEIVDVRSQGNPADVQIDLGDRLTAYQDSREDQFLVAEPLAQDAGQSFLFEHVLPASGRLEYYAIRETANLNDVLVYWMEQGEEGLLWPFLFVRYKLSWSTDIANYSHFVRPVVATEAEARETAVPLPSQNAPNIEYQDSFDRPRAKLTETFEFFTHLDAAVPAHRALLSFTTEGNVVFERVFSWLNSNLSSGDFSESIATQLAAWNPELNELEFPEPLEAPRVVNRTVTVGERIPIPSGELGSGTDETYLAGYVNQAKGTSFSVSGYVNPFESGVEEGNQGAIIPINVIPTKNNLEVWWFRSNDADTRLGFSPTLWPSVLGQYTIQWPSSPSEIVLASNDGSGALSSIEARGSIYYQNDRTAAGYNPNDEHAVLIGGQLFAIRDDLNITGSDPDTYSSDPYVLLEYEGADERPAISVFKVLREKPEEAILFDYISEAGLLLQAPMPLPLLPKPLDANGNNFNTEPTVAAGDFPVNWVDAQDANGSFEHYRRFTVEDRKNNFWIYRGVHAGLPALAMGTYDTSAGAFAAPSAATAIVNETFTYHIHVSRRSASLLLEASDSTPLPSWLNVNGLTLTGRPSSDDEGSAEVDLVLTDIGDDSGATATFSVTVAAEGSIVTQDRLAITSSNSYSGADVTYVGRPPYLAVAPVPQNSFTMRFYYKTQDGFAWPGISSPPSIGSIVPYLRPRDGSGGFVGNPASASTEALDIVYRPVWPAHPPQFSLGDTLMAPKQGLPAIQGQTSLKVLYQQSIAGDIDALNVSAVLHDPTREKSVDISTVGLDRIPPSVETSTFQGRIFFPRLPPHLVERLFFDPNRSEAGHLVFKGEFKDEAFGSDYLLLNVLRGSDLQVVKDLTPSTDTENKTKWDNAIGALTTVVETFHENPAVPGTYIPDPNLDVSVAIGKLAAIEDSNTGVDSYALSASGPGQGFVTLIAGDGAAFTPPGEPVSVHVFRVTSPLSTGELRVLPSPNPLNELITIQHSLDLAGRFSEFDYEWMIAPPVDGLPPDITSEMSGWTVIADGNGIPFFTLGGAGIQVLIDNFLVMRYKPVNEDHPLFDQWSDWTRPQLAEGWIKRVLAGINPFNQRLGDLFNNAVNTDVSLLTQAGKRFEGDVALNLANINDFGLIEIYETVLKRGKNLSIGAGINFGPANDALLLAAGYINDLYMILGNEAFADASNPTIGIGTADRELGDIATALFAFRGQVATLLEEELTLLRGRDDFLLPGVEIAPVYNRLVWNYTRGIDAGEVVYAINYNIQEDPNRTPDGIINAEDAQVLFPQGHGDAYGHYLTALKGYYSLLLDNDFTWVPRIEAVLVLGQPVSVDYQDERKFAAAAAATARAGRSIFDLTWKKDYTSDKTAGWEHFSETRSNDQRSVESTRYWGMDHWASRVGQGSYLNWVVGNAILPEVDPDPTHEGIQKVDRTTVPELDELGAVLSELQTSMDNAEGRLNPLGFPDTSIPFDLNPRALAGGQMVSHFEQINDRAEGALNNALAAFDDAKDVTRLMRSEEDSLTDLRFSVAAEELAFETTLIEIYGTPYPDDIGPGRTYPTGYAGPDLIHYTYVETPELSFTGILEPETKKKYSIDIQNFPATFVDGKDTTFDFIALAGDRSKSHIVEYELGSHGFFGKPDTWQGNRVSPGKIQQAISEIIKANNRLAVVLEDTIADKSDMDGAIRLLDSKRKIRNKILELNEERVEVASRTRSVLAAFKLFEEAIQHLKARVSRAIKGLTEALPKNMIAGLAAGGDTTSPARAGIIKGVSVVIGIVDKLTLARKIGLTALELATDELVEEVEFLRIPELERQEDLQKDVHELSVLLRTFQATLGNINHRVQELDDAERHLKTLIAKGDRVQLEREIFRKRAAAVIQGFRTRDAAFRIFRNEKLERYKRLFDLAALYAFVAAQSFDYETGLLHSQQGRRFIDRIVSARALGIVHDGKPQFAGSTTGDPGLSSALAEMAADWQVLKGRLGFNNPDEYETTVSLRGEYFRILPGIESDPNWRDVLETGRMDNLLEDPDVRRLAMQIDPENGLPVSGIVIDFPTVIASGLNLFGNALAPGDHTFSPSTFATKVFAAGVVFEGYLGMDHPGANNFAVGFAGGVSPSEPDVSFLDPKALSATPFVYLIPAGIDSMRSPPLGDQSVIRTWSVDDVTVPMPFNIGASDFSSKRLFQSADSLSEPLFGVRKHQAFRAVGSVDILNQNIHGGVGGLLPSSFTSNRLIGRSVWNSQWKLVIPGNTLLNDPDEGLDRFIQTVKDIQIHLVTYSVAGN